tara:strand:+ start:639 stop:1496 length:858 start_codon:yes stop_codon:yes gene_type:complete
MIKKKTKYIISLLVLIYISKLLITRYKKNSKLILPLTLSLTKREEQDLYYLFDTFQKLKIEYFIAFGTLIGALRHKDRMPWDDDIDILVNNEDMLMYLKDKKKMERHKPENIYFINKNVVLLHKEWGMPYKLYRYENNKIIRFPFIDINTYLIKNDMIWVDPEQLKHGHIHSFSEKIDDIFPLQLTTFNKFIVPIPVNSGEILKRQYGNDVLQNYKITYNHKQTKEEYYENINASDKIYYEGPMENYYIIINFILEKRQSFPIKYIKNDFIAFRVVSLFYKLPTL